jgi:glutaredoxin
MSTTASAVITVVHSPACHFCDDAQRVLAEFATEYPLTVELVDAGEPRGQALLAAHRAPMFPLVLLDGVFFSVGRLPRKKLRKALAGRVAVAVA